MKPIKRHARAVVRRSSGKWYCWHLGDTFGGKLFHPSIVTEGMEKGAEHCKNVARAAARKFNEQYVEVKVHPPAISDVNPSCERANWKD